MDKPYKEKTMPLAFQPKGKELLAKLEDISGIPVDKKSDIVVVMLDISGSMEGAKISQAKLGAIDFAEDSIRRGWNFSMITFSSYAELLISCGTNIKKIEEVVRGVRASGSTNMANAFEKGIELCLKEFGKRVICVFSDGMPDDPDRTIELANRARNCGISIITIGTEDADHNFLNKIGTDRKYNVEIDSKNIRKGIGDTAKLLPGVCRR